MDQPAPATASADPHQYYSAAEIALAIGQPGEAGKKMVKRTAAAENWPARMLGNKLVFIPPAHIAGIIVAAPAPVAETTAPLVRYSDLAHSEQARALVLMRERAVQLVQENAPATGKETALTLVAAQMQRENPLFRISVSSLRKWCDRYAASGLDGLVEQKRGRVGRKSYASQLQETNLLAAAASSVERGIKGRLNVARGYRDSLLNNPTIEGSSRMWMHGGHASKSYVPPSIRSAIRERVSPLATRLIQIGPKAAKLDGPYTECSYENLKAGQAFTADDMTANCYVWTEWPNEDGWLLIRPQILAAMDVGSMAWLNIRAVIRSKGQYTKDDVWGLVGDVFDTYGLFQTAIFEGGSWQSNLVRGHKTGIEDEARFGGLKSLGVKLIHTRSPRGKIIETAFNSLQHAADHVRGFCGRMEMKDCPEQVRQQLAQVRAGKAHPSQYFLHIADYTKHLEQVMNNLNHERNDGTILRGRAPADKWAEDAPQMPVMPDSHKWMYRAAYRVLQVTRNGIRITVGSGKYQTHYTYSNPAALENHRGRRVVAYWNDYDPDTDVVVYSLSKGNPDKFICTASRVATLDRLGASGEDMRADAVRKKLALQHARTQRASLAPFLTRQAVQIPVADAGTVGPQIQAARDRAAQSAQTRANIERFAGDAGELIQDIPPGAEAAQELEGESRMAQAVPSESRQEDQIYDLGNIDDLLT
ncbi:MAG: helix-turn-helix domain-containing protein [Patescibacteria group bacterium]|nr:helix-turn-helix domain-containing protein [Patescibacteria group bacterium]